MTHRANQESNLSNDKYNLERLINSEFNAQELSMLKMLVLTMLKEYDDVNVNESGNIYSMCKQLYDKICYLQRDNKGY